jgi:TolA-binding protein
MKIFFRLILLIFFIIPLFACETGQGEQLVQKANNEWIKGHNHSAIEMLKSVLKKYPSGHLAEEALFRLGEIHHFSLNDSIQALSYFQEVMELNKHGSFGLDAQKYIAEIMEFTFKNYDQAIIEYQRLIHMSGEVQKNSDHQYRIASIYIKKQNYEQAFAEFETLLSVYPKSIWVEVTQFKILEILYTLNRCPEIQKYYKNFIVSYSDSKYRSEMKFIMASCLEEKGMLEQAYAEFKSLKIDYSYPALLKMKLENIEKRIDKK